MDNIYNVKIKELNKNSNFVKPLEMEYEQDKKQKSWHLIETTPSVAIIIYNKTRNVLVCVKQFRPGVYLHNLPKNERKIGSSVNDEKYPPINGIVLEFCAGMVDKDKTFEEIAAEEVFEECGYSVDPEKLLKIKTYRTSVGLIGDITHLYYVEVTDDMKLGTGGGIDDELIEVVELSIEEVQKVLNSDDDKVSVEFLYGIMWFLNHINKL